MRLEGWATGDVRGLMVRDARSALLTMRDYDFATLGSIGVVSRTPRISSSTFAPASSCASPRGGATICKPIGRPDRREAAGQRQRRAAGQRDRIDDAEPFDIIVELLAVAFGDIAIPDRERRHDGRGAEQEVVGLEELHRAGRHRDALRLGAFDLLDGEFQAFLDIPDHLRLEQVALGAEQLRLGDGEIEGAQHMEAFMRLAQIGMGFLDDHAELREALRGLARDGFDFGIDRRDAEVGRIGDALRLVGRARRRQE